MNRLLETIGALLVIIGLGSADSPNVIVPFLVIVLGGALVWVSGKEVRHGRKTDR